MIGGTGYPTGRSGRYELWMRPHSSVESSSAGGHIVALTSGALDLPDEWLAALLAHQLARTLSRHAAVSLAMAWYSMPLRFAYRLAALARFVLLHATLLVLRSVPVVGRWIARQTAGRALPAAHGGPRGGPTGNPLRVRPGFAAPVRARERGGVCATVVAAAMGEHAGVPDPQRGRRPDDERPVTAAEWSAVALVSWFWRLLTAPRRRKADAGPWESCAAPSRCCRAVGEDLAGGTDVDRARIVRALSRAEHSPGGLRSAADVRPWRATAAPAPDGSVWLVCASQPSARLMLKDLVVSVDGGQYLVDARQAEHRRYTLDRRTRGRRRLPGQYVTPIDATTAVYPPLVPGVPSLIYVTRDGGHTWTYHRSGAR
jgi:hypothetical protein